MISRYDFSREIMCIVCLPAVNSSGVGLAPYCSTSVPLKGLRLTSTLTIDNALHKSNL